MKIPTTGPTSAEMPTNQMEMKLSIIPRLRSNAHQCNYQSCPAEVQLSRTKIDEYIGRGENVNTNVGGLEMTRPIMTSVEEVTATPMNENIPM
ncbi:hypothetical protein Sjap_013656 [Stephania japonica]|uniref:Uncharacterized protein n=1 Tax=Stephania japonica TaxID=461633 RepID=A0AAP0IYA5_9MAGN